MLPWLVMGGSALLGASQAKAQRKAQERQNNAASVQTAMSPWTNMGPGQINTQATPSMLEGAASGALSGYMQGHNIEKALGSGGGGSNAVDGLTKPEAQPSVMGGDAPPMQTAMADNMMGQSNAFQEMPMGPDGKPTLYSMNKNPWGR